MFQTEPESVHEYKKTDHDRRQIIFVLSSLRPCGCGPTFCCALCVTRRPSPTNLQRYTQGVMSQSLLELVRESLLSSRPTPFSCLDRGKTSSRAMPGVWEAVKKKTFQAAKLLCCSDNHETAPRSTARNHPKAYYKVSKWSETAALHKVCPFGRTC